MVQITNAQYLCGISDCLVYFACFLIVICFSNTDFNPRNSNQPCSFSSPIKIRGKNRHPTSTRRCLIATHFTIYAQYILCLMYCTVMATYSFSMHLIGITVAPKKGPFTPKSINIQMTITVACSAKEGARRRRIIKIVF